MKTPAVLRSAVLSLIAVSLSAPAPAADTPSAKPAAQKNASVTGELVDTKCFIEHGARGEKHRKCASACAKDGTPVGIVTADGAYYVIAIQAPFFEPFMAQQARLTGIVDATSRVVVPTKFEIQKDGAWTEVKLPEQLM